MNQMAANFLARSFAPCETVALLLRREELPRPQQRVVTVEQVLQPRYLAWLSHENKDGANVYVSANPLCPGTRKRTKDSIASVRHLYIDIDEDGDVRLGALRKSTLVPSPTAILSTSPGKYQALWRVSGFDFVGQEQTLKILALSFGGDPACTDRNRVLRVPGFLNRKYSPAYTVTVDYLTDVTYSSEDFHLDPAAFPLTFLSTESATRSVTGKHSHSESDWAWACQQIARGGDPAKLTRELASRRSDKANPLYYAQRTIDVASARHWFLEGAPTEDVITMLEVRRRFEIPPALCSSRATEIAATARRLIVRRKPA